ncbi:MAG: OmpA family protein [Gemmatimonadetes bacterium]|nr:OmpA family protein [Gemmatimonadota bacterium]
MRRDAKVLVLTAICALGLAACAKKAPPPAPAPLTREMAPVRSDADSEAAERARREAEARARTEATARARATIEEMIFFDFDRSNIRSDAKTRLDAKIPVLQSNTTVRLRIEGHADERGSVEYNLALGMRRATAAKQYLTAFAIDASRLDVVSFGEERPFDRRSDEEAWAKNRRAEFHIIGGQVAERP